MLGKPNKYSQQALNGIIKLFFLFFLLAVLYKLMVSTRQALLLNILRSAKRLKPQTGKVNNINYLVKMAPFEGWDVLCSKGLLEAVKSIWIQATFTRDKL